MKNVSRREFLRFGGYGMAGVALAGTGLPLFMPKRALASPGAWRFGVMADTQWKLSNATQADSCATGIIDALNRQFINHGVKFVVQVGDLVDVEVNASGGRTLNTRAVHAQALYEAGIGFFPVRGNHEASAAAANELPALFPQTLGQGSYLYGARHFQSPVMSATSTDPNGERLKGLSYAFDFDNLRCVLVDQFVRKDGTNYDGTPSYHNNAVDQVAWVDDALKHRQRHSHAFVFAHKNLIGQNHKDALFGQTLTDNSEYRDQFIASLHENEVGYYMSGHDHMHHQSLVTTSAEGSYSGHGARQIICSSNSYKFYTPVAGDDGREKPFDQELYTIGYYIVTIDGPLVWVDYYSSSSGLSYGPGDLTAPPSGYAFYWRDTSGYSLNGKQFIIGQGASYTSVKDCYKGTQARVLAGTNGNTETDKLGRPLYKNVNTGWRETSWFDLGMASDILTLWGLADNLSLYSGSGNLPGADETRQADVIALSLSYEPWKVRLSQVLSGQFALAAQDEATGKWVNAVDLNYGGAKNFKLGPWKASYGLGTYGVDMASRTVWAVINHGGDFAAKGLRFQK